MIKLEEEQLEKEQNHDEGGLGKLVFTAFSPFIFAALMASSVQIDHPLLTSKKAFLNDNARTRDLYFHVYLMNGKDEQKYKPALEEIGVRDHERTARAYDRLQKYFADNKTNFHIRHYWGYNSAMELFRLDGID